MKFLLSLALAASWTSLFGFPAHAADAAEDQYQILQQEQRQEQIKTSTQRVGRQVDGLIAEFQRNGIAGEDVRILSGIRSVLGRLSEKDMTKVVALLQEAREKNDGSSRQKITSAYSGQKGIILQLRQLLSEFQQQQALQDLAARFEELARKQTVNLKETTGLADLKTSARRSSTSTERQAMSLQLQEIQEIAIKDETQVVLSELEKLSRHPEAHISAVANPAAEKAKTDRLIPGLEEAVAHLKTAALPKAMESETRSRDLLRELARLLGTPVKPTEALRDAMAEMDALIEQEKALIALTRQLGKGVRDAQSLQDRQGEIADKTEMLRQDLKDLAATTPQHLEKSAEKMREVKTALAQRQNSPQQKRESAVQKENEALAKLSDARRSLQDQLSRAEEVQAKPPNPLSTMTNLLAQVRDLKEAQKKVSEKPPQNSATPVASQSQSHQQAKVKQDTAAVQDRAALATPAVAKNLAEAAAAMQKAEDRLKEGADAAPPQASALEALSEAETNLVENVSKLAQARETLEKLADISEELGQVIQKEQAIQKETAKAAATDQKNVSDLAKSQKATQEKAASLQKQAAKASPQTAKSLANAGQKMKQATQQLDKQTPGAAQEPQKESLEEMDDAKAGLEEEMKQLAESLGLPSLESPQDLANAAKAIEQAQHQVTTALEKLHPPSGELQNLQKEQQQLANAVQKLAGKPETSALPASAPHDAQNAADQLAKANLPEAIKQMLKSEEALKAASGSKTESSTTPTPNNPAAARLASEQTALKEKAESLSAGDPAPAVPPLDRASELVSPLTAGKAGPLPSAAQEALRNAQSALAQAAAQASAKHGLPARSQANAAQESLAEAAAALAMAKEGMGKMAKNQGKGKEPSQGQGKEKGKAKGEGEEGEESSNKASRQNMKAAAAEGPRRIAEGSGKFIGLPNRDRAAIQQSQAEKYPAEYGAAIEQYLRNLSEESHP